VGAEQQCEASAGGTANPNLHQRGSAGGAALGVHPSEGAGGAPVGSHPSGAGGAATEGSRRDTDVVGVEKAFHQARARRECRLSLSVEFLEPGVLAQPCKRQAVG
jgi:hypothetical protein